MLYPLTSLTRILLPLFLTLVLSGCGGSTSIPAPLTPMPSELSSGPGDEALKTAVAGYFKDTGAPGYSRYQYALFDLNGDGLRDGIVYIEGPYGYWCGTEGCALLILKARADGFTPESLIRRVRNPVYVSRTRHNGWSDLAVRVAAGEEKAEHVLLRHDGRGYPEPPKLSGQGVLFYPEMTLERFFP